MNLFIAALVLAIPAAMVILSLLLKPAINRVLNILFGIVFTAIMLLISFSTFGEPWRDFYVFYAILESAITILIVWYAIKWPKQIVKKNINILMLGVSYKNVAFPLMFKILDKNKNSHTKDRIELIRKYIN